MNIFKKGVIEIFYSYDFEVFKEDWLVVVIDMTKKKEHIIINNVEELENFIRKISMKFGLDSIPGTMTSIFSRVFFVGSIQRKSMITSLSKAIQDGSSAAFSERLN